MPNVKVVFESEGEIRRYTLPSGPGAFPDLQTKIRSAIGQNTNFRVFWKDNEGDLVSCDSDLELQSALDAVSSSETDTLKLFVRVDEASASKPPTNPASENQDAEMKDGKSDSKTQEKVPEGPKVHTGITCDGCSGDVVGIRYKCTKCRNYDLCETCKGKGFHAEHELQPIEEPQNQEGQDFTFPFPWMNRDFGGGCCRGRGGFNRGAHRFPGMNFMPGMRQQCGGMGGMSQSMGEEGSPQSFHGGFGGPWNQEMPPMPSIDEIAKTLSDMGLQADGGVLRDLIEQFHGDITKIVEAVLAH